MATFYIDWNRDTSKDIISQPATLYTDSTTLTTGMTLYDNTGTDTGYRIDAVYGDRFDASIPTPPTPPTPTTYYFAYSDPDGQSSNPKQDVFLITTDDPQPGDAVYFYDADTDFETVILSTEYEFSEIIDDKYYIREIDGGLEFGVGFVRNSEYDFEG